MSKRFRRRFTVTLLSVLVFGLVWITASSHFSLSPLQFLVQAGRVLVTPAYSLVYRGDRDSVGDITRSYQIDPQAVPARPALAGWQGLGRILPGFRLLDASGAQDREYPPPFVYENPDAAYLRTFRDQYHLNEVVAGTADEYGAMLKLGAWLGTRWDHGTDKVPGSNLVCDPAAVVAAGEKGARYWCEIAARTTVQAATALGWVARVITASRDGYTWEHAVAELWSNQHAKWFVMDTDFNVVYEHAGVPLSAFELSGQGPALQVAGKLTTRLIAPPKPSLPLADLLPFYAYVHVDLRNDWCSRRVSPGSPAGGDLATWWTARPSFGPILTAKTRVDEEKRFNWQVNTVTIHILDARHDESAAELELVLSAYSPTFQNFELSMDNGPWQANTTGRYKLSASGGRHVVQARLVTRAGVAGPAAQVVFELPQRWRG